jgi:feruloyl-CoA synthase
MAQDQVLHGVEADCSARDGVARRGSDVVETEHFHRPQSLHELALALLAHPGFQKTPECHELFRQPPAGQRCRLIERADLLFDQRQVVQRIEYEVVALVGTGSSYDAAIRACIPDDREIVLVDGVSGRQAAPFRDLLAAAPTRRVEIAASAVRPDAVAKLLFTSGSTGFPKGVISTHGMICSMLRAMSTLYPVFAEEHPVFIDWTPWNHSFGGMINFGLALYNGKTFYVDDGKPARAGIETTVRNLLEMASTIYSSVPQAYEELLPWLLKDRELRNRFFSRVKVLQYSGASISGEICEAFDKLAVDAASAPIPWMVVLGSTEAGPMLAGKHPGQFRTCGAAPSTRLSLDARPSSSRCMAQWSAAGSNSPHDVIH